MPGSRKRSIYFPPEMLDEIQKEMERQERTISWMIQQAWRVAHPTLSSLPGLEEHLTIRRS